MNIKRGEIYYAKLNPVVGCEQGGTRPVLIIQNDIGNQYSPTTVIAVITSKIQKAKLPTQIEIDKTKGNLGKDSVILLEQIRTIDKTRLNKKVSLLDDETMEKVDGAIEISLGLINV